MDYSKVVDDEYIVSAIDSINEAIKLVDKVKNKSVYFGLRDIMNNLENIKVDLESELEGE